VVVMADEINVKIVETVIVADEIYLMSKTITRRD